MLTPEKLAEYRKLVEKPTWWVDDVTQRVCGPYSELEKLGWPSYDYVHLAINFETIKEPFVSILNEIERLNEIVKLAKERLGPAGVKMLVRLNKQNQIMREALNKIATHDTLEGAKYNSYSTAYTGLVDFAAKALKEAGEVK